MPVRQRLLRSAPALIFLLPEPLPRPEPGRLRPGRSPGLGRRAPNQSPLLSNPCGPVGRDARPRPVQRPGLVVLAPAAGPGRRQRPDRGPPRRSPTGWAPRSGFGLVLAVAAGLIHKFAPGLRPSPPVGSGGYVGALVATFLFEPFRPVRDAPDPGLGRGSSAWLLCHDVLFTWPVQEVSTWVRSRLDRRRRRHGRRSLPARRGVACSGRSPELDWSRRCRPCPLAGSPRPAPARPTASTSPVAARCRSSDPAAHRQTASLTSVSVAAASSPVRLSSFPRVELLEPPAPFPIQEHEAKIHARAMLLERTLLDFGYQVRVVQIDTGPVITQFEIELEAGLRVSRIMSLADDLAIALAVPSVRIVAPIPGKTTVGIEVPNDHRGMVRLGEVIAGVDSSTRASARSPCSWARTSRGTRWSSTWPTCRTC